MDWAGPSVLPQKRQAKITAHYITYVILRGLGRALGPSAKATTATAKRQCERPVLRSVSCTSYPSTFPCHIRAWGYMCYMQATQVKSGMAWQGGRTGAANVDWRFFLSSRPSKIAFTRSPQATRERSQAAQRGPMLSLRSVSSRELPSLVHASSPPSLRKNL